MEQFTSKRGFAKMQKWRNAVCLADLAEGLLTEKYLLTNGQSEWSAIKGGFDADKDS